MTVSGLMYITVFGTICAFCCYLEGVRRIGAAKGSILAAIEPVASAVLSVVSVSYTHLIRIEAGENEEQVKYQAAHHELVASALATKLAHEIDPENKIGCMLAAGQFYPYTCDPNLSLIHILQSRRRASLSRESRPSKM